MSSDLPFHKINDPNYTVSVAETAETVKHQTRAWQNATTSFLRTGRKHELLCTGHCRAIRMRRQEYGALSTLLVSRLIKSFSTQPTTTMMCSQSNTTSSSSYFSSSADLNNFPLLEAFRLQPVQSRGARPSSLVCFDATRRLSRTEAREHIKKALSSALKLLDEIECDGDSLDFKADDQQQKRQ